MSLFSDWWEFHSRSCDLLLPWLPAPFKSKYQNPGVHRIVRTDSKIYCPLMPPRTSLERAAKINRNCSDDPAVRTVLVPCFLHTNASVHHGITRFNGRICCPCGAIPQRLGFISSDEHVSRPSYPRAAEPMLSFPPSCCSAGKISSLHSCVELSTGLERLHLWRDYCMPHILQRVSKIKLGHALQQPGTHARSCMMTLRCASCAHAAATHAPSCANRIHIDDGNEDLFNFMTTLPEKETWVRCECARKRTADDTFVTRRCVRAHIHTHIPAQQTPRHACAPMSL